MAKNYEELGKQIVGMVGGKENITYFAHCFTRLRFNVKTKDKVKLKELKGLKDVVGSQWSGDQLQIIIGQDVEDLYFTICKLEGLVPTKQIDTFEKDDLKPKEKFSVKSIFNSMVATITACVEPIFIVFTVGGLIRLSVVLLGPATFGVLADDSDIIVLLTMVGDACFRFLPIFIAYTSAKHFGANVPMALILACVLFHPTLGGIVENGETFTVFGIPMIPTSYANTFLPTLLITWILSKVERFFKNLFPRVVNKLFYPLCTILVMLPISLCILGPMGTIFGEGIAAIIVGLNNVIGPVATGLVGALFPLLIVTGMHHALNSAALVEYTKKGFDSCIFAGSYIMDFQLTSLCLALFFKAKKAENKALAMNCLITEGVGGISEPTIFGIVLKSKRNILYMLLGGFLGGFYIGLMHVNVYVFAPSGFMSIFAYSGGSLENFIHGGIACAIAFIVPFILALIFGLGINEEKENENNEKSISTK